MRPVGGTSDGCEPYGGPVGASWGFMAYAHHPAGTPPRTLGGFGKSFYWSRFDPCTYQPSYIIGTDGHLSSPVC